MVDKKRAGVCVCVGGCVCVCVSGRCAKRGFSVRV